MLCLHSNRSQNDVKIRVARFTNTKLKYKFKNI